MPEKRKAAGEEALASASIPLWSRPSSMAIPFCGVHYHYRILSIPRDFRKSLELSLISGLHAVSGRQAKDSACLSYLRYGETVCARPASFSSLSVASASTHTVCTTKPVPEPSGYQSTVQHCPSHAQTQNASLFVSGGSPDSPSKSTDMHARERKERMTAAKGGYLVYPAPERR